MTILFIGSVLLGALLGRFFKVWSLVPSGVMVFVIVFASTAFYGQGIGSALLECAVLGTGLQIGYGSGLVFCVIPGLRRRFETARKSQPPAASIAVTRHH